VHSSMGASRWERDAPFELILRMPRLPEAGRTHPAREQGIYRVGVTPKFLSDVTGRGNEKESL